MELVWGPGLSLRLPRFLEVSGTRFRAVAGNWYVLAVLIPTLQYQEEGTKKTSIKTGNQGSDGQPSGLCLKHKPPTSIFTWASFPDVWPVVCCFFGQGPIKTMTSQK